MQGVRTPGGLQRFVSILSATRNRFALPSRRRAALTIGTIGWKHSMLGKRQQASRDLYRNRVRPDHVQFM